jgi:hypothetical protein
MSECAVMCVVITSVPWCAQTKMASVKRVVKFVVIMSECAVICAVNIVYLSVYRHKNGAVRWAGHEAPHFASCVGVDAKALHLALGPMTETSCPHTQTHIRTHIRALGTHTSKQCVTTHTRTHIRALGTHIRALGTHLSNVCLCVR